MTVPPTTPEGVRALLDRVVDPEIPVLTIAEMGILRDVAVGAEGEVVVSITPTYSGCPALAAIGDRIVAVLRDAGIDAVEVRTVYAPAWSSDWLTAGARAKLRAVGIAPPRPGSEREDPVRCPRCRAARTRTVAEFGSTACKALMVCESCGEPFDRFKEL